MCSAQDYEAIAKILAEARELHNDTDTVEAIDEIVSALSCYFADNYDTFNLVRFANAAGV